ncbi:protein of unknown function DUF81 [Syntrophobotulus glycolicus DSM 8271]|uniref:Probable membrane transporter protein n=1 Tax=Syntrophobotulus glycolicus (strain DSM 8271 / FlGlyR) TaxID=645991 RepID=F0SW14_SYNGF|nr:sulfite exporter TauE/SafE family protein [Syntrophobotulus glycolicus]ADY56798.1 protein of unknown function DUF81 [Syntrophobotulus glycolicus DSM 8271]
MQALLFGLTALFAGFLKNGFGIGAGAFLTPILSLFFEPAYTIPFMTVILLITDIIGVKNCWMEWESQNLLSLIFSGVIGTVVGIILLIYLPVHNFKKVMGLIALIYGLWILYTKSKFYRQKKDNGGISQVLGFQTILWGSAAGVIGAMANAGGIVLNIYLSRLQYDRRTYIGTLMIFLCVMDGIKFIAFTALGLLDVQIWLNIWWTIILVFAGGFLGNKINQFISQNKFELCVSILLCLSGTALMFT